MRTPALAPRRESCPDQSSARPSPSRPSERRRSGDPSQLWSEVRASRVGVVRCRVGERRLGPTPRRLGLGYWG
ncbi:MAG: hypothetical protein JO243_19175, partial [Solirubrobacterales bacterium]|nr:hypothetical protein [Solirubrobacterales bacterium]